ncbi:MAG: bifunctional phosphoribosylaminoimidazolecarboxamide formyltransferase/IMP cyclohydrolase [Bacteroidota bacterium]
MIKTKSLPAPSDLAPVRRALVSVFDKEGLVPFAKRLAAQGVEIISTGGTARKLQDAGLDVTGISEVTDFPEVLGGRVKTLHPNVHAGLLAQRNDPDDLDELKQHGIQPIDLVVVNLYPFEQATSGGEVTDALAIENIDIGGPTMIRAAAKNFFHTAVATSPGEYDLIAGELEANGGQLSMQTRRHLASLAFERTAAYDSAIARYFGRTAQDEHAGPGFALFAPKAQTLRYGENPHQPATFYGTPSRLFETLHGKALSFNNLLDLSAALYLIDEFSDYGPTCAILKHTNPCGVGTAETLAEAYARAFATDRQSPFGGIVVVNRPLDQETAAAIDAIFTEIIIAPEYEEGVLDFLMRKKNRRLIRSLMPAGDLAALDVRSVAGGLLVQERDPRLFSPEDQGAHYRVVTQRTPSAQEMADMDFAWRVCKHVKSNAIVYARGGATLGIGAGQMSRIDASETAVRKGEKSELDFAGCVVASDAFFPFPDGLLAAADAGAVAAIQPGGSIRDEQVINAANDRGMAMVFTGKRHFRH